MTAKVNEGKKAERLGEIELRFLFIWGGGGERAAFICYRSSTATKREDVTDGRREEKASPSKR